MPNANGGLGATGGKESMKYKLITLILVVASGWVNIASAVTGPTNCSAVVCGEGAIDANRVSNCRRTMETCYAGYKVTRCTECDDGYSLTEATVTVPGCFDLNINVCTSDCDGTCPFCETTSWRTYNNNMRRTFASCNTKTCECTKTTQYACVEGYYGTPQNTTSGCSQCPNGGMSKVGDALLASNRSITSCYITDGTDETGEFSFDTGGRFTLCGVDCCSYSN